MSCLSDPFYQTFPPALMTSNLDACNRFPELYYATSYPLRTNVVSIKMPKYRPWAEAISGDLRHLIAQGIDNKMNSRGVPQRKKDFSGLEPISIGQLATLFFMYLLGIVVSLIAFCFEKLQEPRLYRMRNATLINARVKGEIINAK